MKSYTVTLTSANTNYNLKTLIAAINSTFYDQGRQVLIQSNTANTDSVLLGDSTLTGSVYGFNLGNPLDSINLGSNDGKVQLGLWNARSATAAQILNITIIY